MAKCDLCAGLTLLLAVWLGILGCRREPYAIEVSRRFSVPFELLQPHSLQELTNRFKKYSEPMRCELRLSSQAEYAVLTRYPHSGMGTLEVYCYEKVEPDHWLLRGIQFVYGSESLEVASINTNGVLELAHEGRLLNTFMSAAGGKGGGRIEK